MTRSKLHSIAILLTATCIVAATVSAQAQQAPAPAPATGGPPGAPPAGSAPPAGQGAPTASEGPPWPVVMVTSKAEADSIETSYASGCSDYIVKPIDSMELIAKVRDLLGD